MCNTGQIELVRRLRDQLAAVRDDKHLLAPGRGAAGNLGKNQCLAAAGRELQQRREPPDRVAGTQPGDAVLLIVPHDHSLSSKLSFKVQQSGLRAAVSEGEAACAGRPFSVTTHLRVR